MFRGMYYSMEFIDGVTVDAPRLPSGNSIEDKLALFSRICDAIRHAHQFGIIHRDLNPCSTSSATSITSSTANRSRRNGTIHGTWSKKTIRRHRAITSLAVSFALLAVVFFVAITIAYRQARRNLDLTLEQQAKSEGIKDYLVSILSLSDPCSWSELSHPASRRPFRTLDTDPNPRIRFRSVP